MGAKTRRRHRDSAWTESYKTARKEEDHGLMIKVKYTHKIFIHFVGIKEYKYGVNGGDMFITDSPKK